MTLLALLAQKCVFGRKMRCKKCEKNAIFFCKIMQKCVYSQFSRGRKNAKKCKKNYVRIFSLPWCKAASETVTYSPIFGVVESEKRGMDPLQGRFDGEKSDSRAKGGFCRPGLQAGTIIAKCLKYKKAQEDARTI